MLKWGPESGLHAEDDILTLRLKKIGGGGTPMGWGILNKAPERVV